MFWKIVKGYGLLCVIIFVFISIYNEWKYGTKSDCNIKGNVSYNTGEYIYHLPEDQFYDVTEIDGGEEQYFCSVEEAEEAGFRRSER